MTAEPAGELRPVEVVAAGLSLRGWSVGSGPPVVCVHETGTGAEVWSPLAGELRSARTAIAYDRRGWGASEAPEGYARTTIEEQSEDLAAVIEQVAGGTAAVCGAGIGAVVALDLALRRPRTIAAAVLVEPPLLAFLPEATESFSEDSRRLHDALAERGRAGGVEAYLAGSLAAMGAGAQRIPSGLADRDSAAALFAELGAVPAWSLPLDRLGSIAVPVTVVTATSTPPLVAAACARLAERIRGARRVELEARGLPHVDSARALARHLLPRGPRSRHM